MLKLLLSAVSFLIVIPSAFAGTLGVFHGSVAFSGQTPGSIGARIQIGDNCLNTGFVAGTGCYKIFDQVVTSASVGTPFVINSANNTDFNNAVGFLTNGTPDTIWQFGYTSSGAGGNGNSEAGRFGLATVDFKGSTISDILMTPTLFQFNNGPIMQYDLTVEGTSGAATPEPGTFLLLGCTGIAAGLARRKR